MDSDDGRPAGEDGNVGLELSLWERLPGTEVSAEHGLTNGMWGRLQSLGSGGAAHSDKGSTTDADGGGGNWPATSGHVEMQSLGSENIGATSTPLAPGPGSSPGASPRRGRPSPLHLMSSSRNRCRGEVATRRKIVYSSEDKDIAVLPETSKRNLKWKEREQKIFK